MAVDGGGDSTEPERHVELVGKKLGRQAGGRLTLFYCEMELLATARSRFPWSGGGGVAPTQSFDVGPWAEDFFLGCHRSIVA